MVNYGNSFPITSGAIVKNSQRTAISHFSFHISHYKLLPLHPQNEKVGIAQLVRVSP